MLFHGLSKQHVVAALPLPHVSPPHRDSPHLSRYARKARPCMPPATHAARRACRQGASGSACSAAHRSRRTGRTRIAPRKPKAPHSASSGLLRLWRAGPRVAESVEPPKEAGGAHARHVAREVGADASVDFKDAHAAAGPDLVVEVADAREFGEEELHRIEMLGRHLVGRAALALVLSAAGGGRETRSEARQ